MPELKFASAISTDANWRQAIKEVCNKGLEQLEGRPDLAVLFVAQDHATGFDSVSSAICERLGTESLIGCSAESIVGVDCEIEGKPAISLWLARLPSTKVHTLHLTFENTPDGGTFTGWPDELPDPWPADASLVVLGEPYTFPADYLLQRLNDDEPGIPICGGMASGAAAPGESRLWLGRKPLQEGAVAALLYGGVRMRTLVSQGCRPIGHHYIVTKADQNVILELGGKPALEQLQELFPTLSTREQKAVQQGLHVGRVVSEYQDHFEQGDFLVRNVIGYSKDHGAIAVGDFIRPGQTVQFHIRDAETADAELQQLLAQAKRSAVARAALLFTCNGRGTRLFDAPHHDAGAISQALENIPLAGFFAAGELGPIAGKNFMHGFTASVALFEEG